MPRVFILPGPFAPALPNGQLYSHGIPADNLLVARILLVDDAVDLRNALMYALQSEGHTVATADDGEQGMNLQRGFKADVLITDIFMPNKDGIETIQEFKEASPGA